MCPVPASQPPGFRGTRTEKQNHYTDATSNTAESRHDTTRHADRVDNAEDQSFTVRLLRPAQSHLYHATSPRKAYIRGGVGGKARRGLCDGKSRRGHRGESRISLWDPVVRAHSSASDPILWFHHRVTCPLCVDHAALCACLPPPPLATP
jgi:hypothetical protein